MMSDLQNFSIKQMSPQLQVTNLERAITFYTEKLGFEIEFRYEDFYAGIVKDGHSIHLKLIDTPAIITTGEDQHLNITFSVNNIRQLYQQLSTQQVHFTQSLREMPYGTEFYIADPDGNILAFLQTE